MTERHEPERCVNCKKEIRRGSGEVRVFDTYYYCLTCVLMVLEQYDMGRQDDEEFAGKA